MKRKNLIAGLAVCLLASAVPSLARQDDRGGQSADQPEESPVKTLSPRDPKERREYRLLATKRTGTMQKELNEAAAAGFRFQGVMAGGTAFGGAEVVSIMMKEPDAPARARYEYRLLATTKTSTMQKEMQEAGDAGFEYRGQTISGEVMVILERDIDAPIIRYEYLLLATKRTGTMQKELQEAGDKGFSFVGVTVHPTAFGGSEVVSILRRKMEL
jgi:hypothetical protein